MNEHSSLPRGAIKGAAVMLMLAFAVALPSWLYYKRGRKLPLRVLLEAERYVVAVGQDVPITVRVLPSDAKLDELRWEGPGKISGSGTRVSWKAPSRPGVASLRFAARRGATYSDDEISLKVLPRAPESYPLSAPPSPLKPPPAGALCTPPGSASFVVHGSRCRGARAVVELKSDASWRRVWLRAKGRTTRGRFRELRLSKQPGVVHRVSATIVDGARACVHRFETRVAVEDCVGGPRADALFADFQWELASPGLFRLAAKPPRAGQKRVTYRWTIEGKTSQSDKPQQMIRLGQRARHTLVRLEIGADGARASTIGLLEDRSYEGR